MEDPLRVRGESPLDVDAADGVLGEHGGVDAGALLGATRVRDLDHLDGHQPLRFSFP
jgi:hypothetical protein